MNRLIEILFWTVLLLAVVGLLCAWLAVKAVGADFGATDLAPRPPLFPTNAPPTHLAAPVEFPGLMPPVVTVAHPAAVVVPGTNKPIVLPAFKYPPPGSNQMWAVQVLSNRTWVTIAAGVVTNDGHTSFLPYVLPAAGTLEVTNKAPFAAYRVMGRQKQ